MSARYFFRHYKGDLYEWIDDGFEREAKPGLLHTGYRKVWPEGSARKWYRPETEFYGTVRVRGESGQEPVVLRRFTPLEHGDVLRLTGALVLPAELPKGRPRL